VTAMLARPTALFAPAERITAVNPASAQRIAPVTEDAVTVAGVRNPYLHAGPTDTRLSLV
jgi:hypothetical protein